MKIEKITDNQLKITFDSIELEENNISVHSFLSHSLETQKMYLAILEIAYEDLGFDTKNSILSYETISFGHYLFVTFITKSLNKDFSSNSLNVFKTHFKTNLSFPREFNYIDQTQYLFFSSINNFLDFYNLLHKTFTKIHFLYPHATATIKVGKGVKSEGELIISGTKGYIYVPAPWWKTDYFEVRYENPENNRRHFYQLDGEGIRYQMVAFAKTIETGRDISYISKEVSLGFASVIEDFYQGKDVSII